MNLKKVIGWLHRWLGLLSGLPVFIVAVTGCCYAFQAEIQEWLQPYRKVVPGASAPLLPSQIGRIADSHMPGKHIHGIIYGKPDRAVQAMYWKDQAYYDLVFLNPYTGRVLQVKDMKHSFFPWILEGHEFLWLPPAIGRLVVASATLIFFVLLLSGLYLWWPRNKAGKKQRFRIKKGVRWKRRNYDLHNVLGFYVFSIAAILALSGLLFGFDWFVNGAYYALSGGHKMQPYFDPGSDTTAMPTDDLPPVDRVYLQMGKEYPKAEVVQLYFPQNKRSAVDASANPDASTYWKVDYRYWDQHSGKEIPSQHLWKRLSQANGGDLLIRMAYDIHVGGIAGLPGKCLAFFASLLIASLPITGAFIWWGRGKKR
ncbi:Uncharacterized iron-regulated membrane protein [bacterium A37T11]|nr:Uncharacterized iron-regulated membrane protein [bacterium A37T11]